LKYEPGGEPDGWFLGVEDDVVEHALVTAASVGVNVEGARRALPGLAAVSRTAPRWETITCHNDVDRNNVLVVGEGAPVLVDWDNAGPLFAPCEFAGLLWSWACDGDLATQATAIAAMTHAYRDAGGVFEPTGLEVFAPTCSAWVHYTVNCCEHLADAETPPEILEFERPVVDRLSEFHVGVARLEQILEMIPA
jgi:Ser/Thr protein kinase RdoA (MazF antagonist)